MRKRLIHKGIVARGNGRSAEANERTSDSMTERQAERTTHPQRRDSYSVWPSMNSRRMEVGGMAAISAGVRATM